MSEKLDFSQRELDEITLSLHYTRTTNHGTSGHLAHNIIAKLAWAVNSGYQIPEVLDTVRGYLHSERILRGGESSTSS